ncbi:MAG: 16S rRNA (cytidine(1402)-2'-O)-methyltransferase [Hyphomicrobium sp.]
MSRPDDDSDADQGIGASRRIVQRIVGEVARLDMRAMPAGLYIVATPIGNLADITLRALHVLSHADVIYCEDTRGSARLLQHYGIQAQTLPFHEHNEDAERARVIARLKAGGRVALISDAGTPLIADPGFKLVRACGQEGLPVFPIPGASALVTALCAAGLPTDQFTFAGFLPPKQAARRTRLSDLKSVPGTLVFYEAPQRAAQSLFDMAEVLGERQAVVARELTKLHEELARGALKALADDFTKRDVKGEIVVVVGPAEALPVDDDAIAAQLKVALASMRLKDAAAAVADALGVAKSRVYAIGLKEKDKHADEE